MKTVAKMLQLAAQHNKLPKGFHFKIEKGGFMALILEDIQTPGPNGHPTLSIAHYGEQNGDLMADPEMMLEIVWEGDTVTLHPYYFRNDYVGVEEWSRKDAVTYPKLKKEHIEFAQMWDKNIEEQGFFEAFKKLIE